MKIVKFVFNSCKCSRVSLMDAAALKTSGVKLINYRLMTGNPNPSIYEKYGFRPIENVESEFKEFYSIKLKDLNEDAKAALLLYDIEPTGELSLSKYDPKTNTITTVNNTKPYDFWKDNIKNSLVALKFISTLDVINLNNYSKMLKVLDYFRRCKTLIVVYDNKQIMSNIWRYTHLFFTLASAYQDLKADNLVV